MRKSWVAIGIVTLLVGLGAGYRLGRSGPAPAAGTEAGRHGAAASGARGTPDERNAGTRDPGGEDASAPASADGAAPAGEPGAPGTRTGGSIEAVLGPPKFSRAFSPTFAAGDAPPSSPPPNGGVGATATGAEPVRATGGSPRADKAAQPAAPPVPYPGAYGPGASGAPRPDPPKAGPTPPPSVPDDPSSDRHPPALQFLRFDPPEIRDGAMSVLTIGATDDLSGVKSVFGTIRSPGEAAVIPFVGQDAGGTGAFTATITIPKKAETGDWFVGTLQIVDKADNPFYATYVKGMVPPGGALRVVSSESDSAAPTVQSVTLDKQTIGGGEKDRVVVEADDDRSGVASVTGTFQSRSKAAFLPFKCAQKGPTSWAADFAAPANAECGEWTLMQLRVADKANNAAVLMADSPELGHVSFFVASGGGCDSDPPVLDAVYVAPNVVSNAAPSDVVLTITAHDDGSGVASLTGRVEGPPSANGQVPRIFFSTQPDPKNPDAPMVAKITVPQLAAKGIWRVSVVELTDKAHNTKAYNSADPAVASATFTVE